MAVNDLGLDDQFVHYHPILCLPPYKEVRTYNDLVRCSTRIKDVTCPTCMYYYTHPEARQLELDFRDRRTK